MTTGVVSDPKITTQVVSTTSTSTPTGPIHSIITTGNVAVVVFGANTITSEAYIQNPPDATEPLYVDMVNTATIGSSTSSPIYPGGTFHISRPITTQVTAVAATSGHAFSAVKY